MTQKKTSLKEFAGSRSVKSKCTICLLPPTVRKEVENGMKDGIAAMAIVEWLRATHGVQLATKHAVCNHRNNHVQAEE